MIKFGRLIVVVLNSNLTKLEASRTNYSATTSSNIHFSNGKNKKFARKWSIWYINFHLFLPNKNLCYWDTCKRSEWRCWNIYISVVKPQEKQHECVDMLLVWKWITISFVQLYPINAIVITLLLQNVNHCTTAISFSTLGFSSAM